MNRVIFKSMSDEWRTPESLYQKLNEEFKFKDDPCRIGATDGLTRMWNYPAFCNPPYSNISEWVKECFKQSANGIVVMLIPSRTDTRWWHDYVMNANEIRFIKGRLNFTKSDGSNQRPRDISKLRCCFQFDNLKNISDYCPHAWQHTPKNCLQQKWTALQFRPGLLAAKLGPGYFFCHAA